MSLRTLVAAGLIAAFTLGCGADDKPYEKKAAFSGTAPSLPAVPNLRNDPKKVGTNYTIFGASHDLRSDVHGGDFSEDVTLVGYIVATNYEEAPECAIHKMGKADPEDCKPPAPRFFIADRKDETTERVTVLGWASNWAQIFDMIEAIDKDPEKAEVIDVTGSGASLPNPLPEVGAKVEVTGHYGVSCPTPSKGLVSDPKYGCLRMAKMKYLEPPSKFAVLKGMKVKPEGTPKLLP